MALLVIKRNSEYVNKLRKIGIYVNSVKTDEISDGETIALELPNGTYTIKAKIDWCSSNLLTINMYDDKATYQVNLSSGFKSDLFLGFRLMYYILFAKNKYLKLVEL